MKSARSRERVLSGRTNRSSTPRESTRATPRESTRATPRDATPSATPRAHQRLWTAPPVSARAAVLETAPSSGRRRPPGKNQFAMPLLSEVTPLRSVFLDEATNTIPRSRTQSDLHKKMRSVNMPHISYDVDGDGYVSQQDFKISKRYDVNRNGVLEASEQTKGRRQLAESFFEKNSEGRLFGASWDNDAETNAQRLSSSKDFEATFRTLEQRDKCLSNYSSKTMRTCMGELSGEETKFNFYTDKFDSTAYTDFGSKPRGLFTPPPGSRDYLFQRRKLEERELCQTRLNAADSYQRKYSASRMSLISNIAIENG